MIANSLIQSHDRLTEKNDLLAKELQKMIKMNADMQRENRILKTRLKKIKGIL